MLEERTGRSGVQPLQPKNEPQPRDTYKRSVAHRNLRTQALIGGNGSPDKPATVETWLRLYEEEAETRGMLAAWARDIFESPLLSTWQAIENAARVTNFTEEEVRAYFRGLASRPWSRGRCGLDWAVKEETINRYGIKGYDYVPPPRRYKRRPLRGWAPSSRRPKEASRAFLADLLADGRPRPVAELVKAGLAAGFAESAIRRARQALGWIVGKVRGVFTAFRPQSQLEFDPVTAPEPPRYPDLVPVTACRDEGEIRLPDLNHLENGGMPHGTTRDRARALDEDIAKAKAMAEARAQAMSRARAMARGYTSGDVAPQRAERGEASTNFCRLFNGRMSGGPKGASEPSSPSQAPQVAPPAVDEPEAKPEASGARWVPCPKELFESIVRPVPTGPGGRR